LTPVAITATSPTTYKSSANRANPAAAVAMLLRRHDVLGEGRIIVQDVKNNLFLDKIAKTSNLLID